MLRYLLILLVFVMITVVMAETDARVVTFETTYGNIIFKVFPDAAPLVSSRFLELCEKGYYEGTYFHFVDEGFIIAAGDLGIRQVPLENEILESLTYLPNEISAKALGLDRLLIRNSYLGSYLPRDHPARRLTMKEFLEQQGYSFNDALPSLPNKYGTLAMASNEPNTNRMQFFIVTAKEGAPWLDGKNTVVGQVQEGMEVVHKIEQLPSDESNNPLPQHRAMILRITVD